MEPGLIELRTVRKEFPRPRQSPLVVLDGVSLAVRPREVVGVVGPSGCGKTTLLRLVAGLERPTGGEVRFQDARVEGPGHERGLMFQDYGVFPWLRVAGNIGFALKLQGGARSARRARTLQLIELVGLQGFERAFPSELSGGMQQRVALARLLAAEPKVLLLDEPFGALDAQTRARLQDVFQNLVHEQGLSALFVTHDLEEALFLSDVVHVLSPIPARITETLTIEVQRPRGHDLKTETEFASWRRHLEHILRRSSRED